uniref:Uncharacterized protein n=1 Tax=Graphocephala atropunctata TaxID=36148 RepID=A0A1B6LGU5_9HEMI
MIMIAEIIVSRLIGASSQLIDTSYLFSLPDFNELDIWNKRAQLASIIFNSDRGSVQLAYILPMLFKSFGRLHCEGKENNLNQDDLPNKIERLEDSLTFYIDKIAEQEKVFDMLNFLLMSRTRKWRTTRICNPKMVPKL